MQKKNEVKNNSKGSTIKRSLLAVSTVFVIGATTVSAQSSDHLSMFFEHGESGILENQHSSHISKVVSGIEMEIEETIIGGKSALIIVSFKKEDGTAFSDDIKVSTLELDWKQDVSYMVEQQMTEDRKKLITIFDIDTTKNIDGEKIKIMADHLVNRQTDKVIANGPFHLSFEAIESNTSRNIDTNINLTALNEKLTLHTINISANGIGVEGTSKIGQTDELPKYIPVLKVTTLDNTTFELTSSSTSTTESGFKWQYNIDKNGERQLLNSENIKSVMIDGHIIDVTQE